MLSSSEFEPAETEVATVPVTDHGMVVSVRFGQATARRIVEQAERDGMTVTGWVRRATLDRLHADPQDR